MVGAVSSAPPAPPTNTPAPKNATAAATEFEALLLAQMLRAAHNAEDREDQGGDDAMWDLAAQQFAGVMAENGGLGLSRLLVDGLNPPAK
jgi:Rod binding domain-containing protein